MPEAASLAAQRDTLTERVHRAFSDAEIFILTRAQIVSWPLDSIARAARESAVSPDSKLTSNGWGRSSRPLRTSSPRPSGRSSRFEPDSYEPDSVLQFRAFDGAALPVTDKAGVRLRAGGGAAELVDQLQPQAVSLRLEALLL